MLSASSTDVRTEENWAIVIYLAALVDLFVRLPVYSTAKATYLLGLLPCFAVLAGVGAAPLLQFRVARELVFSAVAVWAFASYAAYFNVSAIARLLSKRHDQPAVPCRET